MGRQHSVVEDEFDPRARCQGGQLLEQFEGLEAQMTGAALRAALPWWKRKELDRAWHRYMVVDYYDQIFGRPILEGVH